MVLDYIHDYICIYGDYCGSLNEQQRFCVVATLVALSCKQTPFGIAEAQIWIWKEELRIRAYYAVLDAIHDPARIVAQAFVEEVKSRALRMPCSVGDIDVLLFDILFSVIDPSYATGLRKQRIHSLASANNLASMNNIASALSGSVRTQPSEAHQNVPFILEWMKQVENIRLPFDLLFSVLKDTIADSDTHLRRSMLSIDLRWKSIHLFQDFVEEIGIPFSLSPASYLEFWVTLIDALDEHSSLSWTSCSSSSTSLSSESPSATTLIPLEEDATPSAERSCLCSLAVFKAILSFLDTLLDEETSLEQRQIGDEATVRQRFSAFLEKYLVAYCFCEETPAFVDTVRASQHRQDYPATDRCVQEQQILAVLGGIIADCHIQDGANLKLSNLPKIQLSESLRYSVLRVLLSVTPANPTLKAAIDGMMEPLLSTAFHNQSETSLMLLNAVVHVIEDMLISENVTVQHLETLLQPEMLELAIRSIHSPPPQMEAPSLALLQLIAALRRALYLLATDLVSAPVSTNASQYLTQALLRHNNLRVVLMREIVALRGYGYILHPAARSKMQHAIPWIADVVQDLKVAELVPYHNLLSAAYRSYPKVAEALKLAAFYSAPTTDNTTRTPAKQKNEAMLFAPLSSFLCSNEFTTSERRSLLMLGVFLEVYLLYSNETAIPADGIARLTSYFRDSGYLDFLSSDERELLVSFCTNKWSSSVQAMPSAGLSLLSFEIDRTADVRQLTLLYVVIHVCIVSSALDDADFLWRLFSDPASLGAEYLPTMPDNMSSEVLSALHRQGNFFRCQNGHVFFVGECGGPMERSTCPECGCVIGGKDHILDPSNSRIDTAPEQFTGYAIHRPEDEQVYNTSVRSLSPIAFRIVRILLHSLLALSCATANHRAVQIDQLINRQFPKPPYHSAAQYFLEHLATDWTALCKLLHCTDEQASILMFKVLQQYVQRPSRGFSRLLTPQRRNEWEAEFQQCVRAVVFDKRNTLSTISSSVREKLRQLLTPTIDPASTMALDVTFQAQLWRHRTPITFELFSQHLTHNESGSFVLLRQFIEENQLLSALRYIPSMIKWLRMLAAQFHHKIDRNYARDHTIRDAINSLGSWHERQEFDGVFRDICAAWRLCINKIEQFDCTALPNAYKSIELNDQLQLSFVIPDEKDESICFLALLHFMFEKHNQILEKMHEVGRSYFTHNNNRIGDLVVSPTHEIGIAQFAEHHAIKFDLEREFVPYLQAHARAKENGASHFDDPVIHLDFDKIEQFVVKQFLSGKPLLRWDDTLRTFPFIEERKAVTTDLSQLSSIVPQKELSTDMKRSIMANLESVEQARHYLADVETCIGFLLASRGDTQHQLSRIEEMPIHTYFRDVLLMSTERSDMFDAPKQPEPALFRGVQLRHLRSLWNVLHAYLNDDLYAEVRPKYRAPLDEPLTAVLKDRAPRGLLELHVLVPCLQEFVTSALLEDYLSGTESLKNALGFMPVPALESQILPHGQRQPPHPSHHEMSGGETMSEVPWFAAHFPDGIRVEHAMRVLQLLQGLLQ